MVRRINDLYGQLIKRNNRVRCLLELDEPEVPGLSSPSILCRRVTRLLADPETNREQISKIISHDPGLTARVLKAASNLPYLATQNIEDIYKALSVIEEDDLRTLIATATAVDTFNYLDTDLVDMASFWNHSVCCGVAARVLAERCGRVNPSQVYTAGLLHDIGQLVIYHALPESAAEVLRHASEPEEYRYRAEREIIGVTHAEVGAELIKSWGLPESLIEVVQFHHEPIKAKKFPVETALVHIATGVVNRIEPSWKMSLVQRESLAQINPHAWTVTGLSPETIHATLEAIGIESYDVMALTNVPMPLVFSAM